MPFDFMPGAPLGDPAFSNIFGPSAGGPASPTIVNCTLAAVNCAGLPASVGSALSINCSLALAQCVGLPVTIITPTIVNCGKASVICSGLPATLPVFSGLITCVISFLGTESKIPLYDINDTLVVQASFSDTLSSIPIDPASLTFRLKSPLGVITMPTPTRIATGEYEMPLVATLSGMWRFTWSGTGVSQDGQFAVSSSLSDAI